MGSPKALEALQTLRAQAALRPFKGTLIHSATICVSPGAGSQWGPSGKGNRRRRWELRATLCLPRFSRGEAALRL